MRQIGRRAKPKDWEALTSGRFAYSSDLAQPGLLIGRILRSPHPHARIKSIDISAASRMPGVQAVITAADFPDGVTYPHEGAADREPMASAFVRFVGQEVAAVAAETSAQADAALLAIAVAYEPLDAPFTIAQAQAPGAPQLHRRATGVPNVARHLLRRWGDVEAARAACCFVVEGSYWYPHQTHVCMETNNTLALWDEEEQRLHLWTGTQGPALVIEELAPVIGLEPSNILCHEAGVGGGFGSKSRISEHEAIAAQLARKARRPVRVALTRTEEFATTKTRHAWRVDLKVHADSDGRLRALDGKIVADNGAYVHSGYSVLSCGPKAYGTLYGLDALAVEALLVDTCKQPGGQFRGYGTTQALYALESLMDDLAERMDLDPIELRLRNANRPFTETVQGARMQSARLAECLEAVRGAIDWDAKKARRWFGRGVGVACGIHSSGTYALPGANRSDSAVDIFADGRVRLRFGGTDAGTGQKTILAQIVAEELGLDADDIEVLSTETQDTPFDLGAWASRGTYYSGNAARKAAALAAQRLKTMAAAHLGNEEVRLEGGTVRGGGKTISLAELVAGSPQAADGVLTTEASYVETDAERLDPATGRGNLSATYSFAAHAAEVEVDVRTGRVRVLDYVAAHDIGTALNPMFVEGQIAGGVAMGLGAALGEQLIHEQGRLVNPAFLDYAMPRAADLPRIRTILIEGGDPKGPYGAKGVGELCITPPAPAVANAVYDAIGVRIRDLPITPDKIIEALAAKEGRRRSHCLWRRPDRWWTALVRWAYPRGLFRLLHRHGRVVARPAPQAIEAVEAPTNLGAACWALGPQAISIAGGTDALPHREQGLSAPKRFVSLLEIPDLQKIEIAADGAVVIGAAVTLKALGAAAKEFCPMLARAIESIASPQIRAMATVGGNLLQDKRCWFYRNGFDCYKRSGAARPCYAVLGDHRFHHAAIGGDRCQAVTPSDLASVFIALDAQALLVCPAGSRTVPVGRLYSGPGESVLRPDEILAEIRIGGAATARLGVFEKLVLWQGDFALVSVAVTVVAEASGQWGDARIVFGGLAARPWRAYRTEAVLNGGRPGGDTLRRAIDREFDRAAHPLPRNGWKLDAAAGLLEHAVEQLGPYVSGENAVATNTSDCIEISRSDPPGGGQMPSPLACLRAAARSSRLL